MAQFICVRCGGHTNKTVCPSCHTKTAKKLDKDWTRIVGTRFRYNNLKYGVDDYEEDKA